ncbi:MAG: glycosyltransferase [Thermoanaerobaculia bacterium]
MPEQQDPTSGRRSPGLTRRRITALEERLQDLAQDQRRLHEQLREILDLLASRGDVRSGDPAASPPAAGTGPRRRPENSLARRALRFALRSTLGLLKRLWRASDPARDWFVEVELARRPAAELPSLGAVTPDADAAAVRQATEADVLVAAGDREAVDGTASELARLAFAAEDLAFLAGPPSCGDGTTSALWVRRELWHPDTGIDRRALARRVRGRRAVVGKSLGGHQASGLPGMVAVGNYRVSKKHLPYRHRVRPLTGLGARQPIEESPSPVLLIVLGAALAGGLEQLVADLARTPGDGYRLVFASTTTSDELQAERLRQLARAVPRVYPLADWLPAEVLPSAVEFLVRRHRAAAVLHLGKSGLRPAVERQLAGMESPPAVLEPPAVACGVPIPEPVLPRRRGEARAELGVPADAILVTMISDLVARQRPEDFVAVAHRCRDDGRLFFLLAGRGPLAGTVGDLERFLAPGNFRAVSTAPVADVLAASDIACALGEDGDFPAFILAALAAGVPVVATDVDGLGDLVADGPCGTAVPVADLAACEEAIRGMTEEAKRSALGTAGRRLIERRFRVDDVMAGYRRRLDEATRKPGLAPRTER